MFVLCIKYDKLKNIIAYDIFYTRRNETIRKDPEHNTTDCIYLQGSDI